MILADRDESGAFTAAADGTLEKRRYYGQNWRSDTAMVATDTGKLVENVKYFSNGVTRQIPAGDTNCDFLFDATDAGTITGAYDVVKDADMDGDVDANDVTQANAFGGYYGLTLGQVSVVSNRKGYAGYESEPNLLGSKFHVRNRVFDGETGRWTKRDPLQRPTSENYYQYADHSPLSRTDQSGLIAQPVTLVAMKHVVPGFVFGRAEWGMKIEGGLNCPEGGGWIVQHVVKFTSNAVGDKGPVSPCYGEGPGTLIDDSYYEAWRILHREPYPTLGNQPIFRQPGSRPLKPDEAKLPALDAFASFPGTIMGDSSGGFIVKGYMMAFCDLDVQGPDDPKRWLTTAVPDTGGLPARRGDAPGWFVGTSPNSPSHVWSLTWDNCSTPAYLRYIVSAMSPHGLEREVIRVHKF